MNDPSPWDPRALNDRLPGVASAVSALLAASCCLLPIALITLGIAGAGIMMTMMRYEWLTLPLGVGGLVGAAALYVSNRRRCETTGCRFVGQRFNQAMLGLAALVVAVALLLKVFPAWTATLLQQL